MPAGKKKQFGKTIYWECDEATTNTLKAIERDIGIAPVEFARRLTMAGCQFYRDHGYFHFPVLIEPVPRALAAEREQAPYGEEQPSTKK